MSAILDSLRNQQPHPMFAARSTRTAAHVATVTRTPAARPVQVTVKPAAPARRNQFTYAQADTAVLAVAPGMYALPRTTPDSAGNLHTAFKVFEAANRDGSTGHRIVQLIGGGANGGFREIRLSVDMQVFAARHIAEDPHHAMRLFGQRTGTCGYPTCGRKLTNDESVAYGMGPVCRTK